MEAGALQAPAGLSRISIAAPLLRLRTDDQLVALFRAGNEDAFQVIFDRYRQRLFAYTRQMLAGSRQDAEDALQDVFLRAYGALRANDRPVSLRAWLYRVAHNRCIDQLRRPVPASADVFDVSRAPLKDPIDESQRREDLRRLVEDVRRLPEAQRSALLMREMEGLSYQDLAAALDVTVPAVKSLLVRARIGLVEAIEARDTACTDIRNDLLASYDKGVRATGKARRHLRDCAGCRAYRTQLRSVQRGLGALSPGHSGPIGMLAKVFGIGGGAGGAAAGGTAVVGGGGAAVVGGGAAATVTACKVAALVCSAALVTGAASDIESAVRHVVHTRTPAAHAATPSHGARHAAAGMHASLTAPHIVRLPARSTAGASAAAAITTAAVTKPAHLAVESGRDEPSAAVAYAHHEARVITPDDEVYAEPQSPTQGATSGAGSVAGASAGDTVGGGVKAPDEPATAPASTTGTGTSAPATGTTGTPSAATTTGTAPTAADGTTAPTTGTGAATGSTGTSGSSATAAPPALTVAATATGSH
ncbi:RNA polymerase sigma factor [Capillimicrobium parvum]|uniref:Sigma-70 family RNA polymerase sigma factor n=1 Tax=Capillimicrobium parvum TaxID=2884022 RepID=A0A9E6Y0Z0_9ACTN|nr:RNA polymerase sigma factor [Capillimicrobium parvum]UGS38177.1 hypothetical protein DSM104329_04600 [Capillimicrobium parvum]